MSKGEANELRKIAKNVFNDTVPKVWKQYTTLELNVTEWILDFKDRINQLNTITTSKDYGKSSLWLGGLILPESYLTSARQYVAQELKVPLDELVLSVKMVQTVTEVDKTSFVLKGYVLKAQNGIMKVIS